MMHGRCLCGKVAFELSGAAPRLYQCHCSLCRKQGGSTSNTAAIVANELFRWVAGQDNISSWVRETGFRSDFCSTCGSPVPNPLRDTPYYWVPSGLLEDAGDLEIVVHIFVGSKASWDTLPAPAPRFDTTPGLPELIRLLHAPSRGGPGE